MIGSQWCFFLYINADIDADIGLYDITLFDLQIVNNMCIISAIKFCNLEVFHNINKKKKEIIWTWLLDPVTVFFFTNKEVSYTGSEHCNQQYSFCVD